MIIFALTLMRDYMIVGTDPTAIMDMSPAIYAVKFIGPPDYYLGNDRRLLHSCVYCSLDYD